MIYIEYFGIDVGKGKSFIAHYSNETFIDEFELIHNKSGFENLLNYVKQYAGIYILFESTGIYSKPLERFCNENYIPYSIVNPLESKLMTNTLRTWKTDKSDAHKLANLAKHYNKQPSQNMIKDIHIKIREVTRYYEELSNQMTYLKSTLIQLLDMTFPELQILFKDRYSKIALRVAKLFPHPDYVDVNNVSKLKELIANSTNKRLSDKKVNSYVEKLVSYTNESYPSVPADSFFVDKLIYTIDDLLNSMERQLAIQTQLIDLAQTLDEFKILTSIPGIGELTAAMVIGELGDIRAFTSHKQLNAYIGIDIKRYQSGKTHYKDKINKRGNKRARSLFYIIVQNMLKVQRLYANHIVDYYYKLKEQPYGKGHKTAVIACVNKLLKTIHHLVINNKEYDYRMSSH